METVLFFILISIFSIFIIFLLFYPPNNNNSSNKSPTKRNKNGFTSYPLLGTLPEFLANRHRFLDWTTAVLSSSPSHTATFFRPGKVHGVITAYPPNVEHILKTQFINYPKGPRFISLLHDFLGNGIFNSDDYLWRLHRKTASFHFNNRSLKTTILSSIHSLLQTRFIPLLFKASWSSQAFDLQDLLERFAFDNICKLAFNVDPCCMATGKDRSNQVESEFMQAFEKAATLSSERFMYMLPGLWKIKKFLNIGSEKKLRESIKTVHEYADNIILSRLHDKSKSTSSYDDLLSRFISSTQEEVLSLSNANFLRDIVISFILAGRDTTSSGLSWFFWLLSHHPDVLDHIRSELKQVRTRVGKRVGDMYDFDELKEMHYLHVAISESLRLYPPVPVNTRVCATDDVLPDGTIVKKDWFVSYQTFAMGRMESIWGKDCLEFKPERWIDENGLFKSDSPFRYTAFHAGPRICLGKEVAYIQMKSIVACVVEQFEVDVMGKETRPEMLLSLTLRMKNGLLVKVKDRDNV